MVEKKRVIDSDLKELEKLIEDNFDSLEVIQLLEGSIALVDCVNDPGVCNRSNICAVRDLWRELKQAMNGILESMTLQDLMERQRGKEKPVYYI